MSPARRPVTIRHLAGEATCRTQHRVWQPSRLTNFGFPRKSTHDSLVFRLANFAGSRQISGLSDSLLIGPDIMTCCRRARCRLSPDGSRVSASAHWFPRDDLEATSLAFGVLFAGRSDDSAPRKVGADAWFDRPCATRFMV